MAPADGFTPEAGKRQRKKILQIFNSLIRQLEIAVMNFAGGADDEWIEAQACGYLFVLRRAHGIFSCLLPARIGVGRPNL